MRRHGTTAVADDIARLIEWETIAAEPGAAERLLDVALAAGSTVEFTLTHRLVEGDWPATGCHVRVPAPFHVDAQVSPWVAALLVRCDGARPVRALLAELRAEGLAPAEAELPDAELAPLLAAFVSAGILLVPETGAELADRAGEAAARSA